MLCSITEIADAVTAVAILSGLYCYCPAAEEATVAAVTAATIKRAAIAAISLCCICCFLAAAAQTPAASK